MTTNMVLLQLNKELPKVEVSNIVMVPKVITWIIDTNLHYH